MKKEYNIISELIEEKSRTLDVGCGNGDLMKYLFENKTKHIRGLEISKKKCSKLSIKRFARNRR